MFQGFDGVGMMKRFLEALYDAAGTILLLVVILLSMFGLFTAVDIAKGNLVWKAEQQQHPAVSAVTREDLKAFMEVVNRRDAAQDVIIMGLVSRMDIKQGVGK